MSRNWGISPKSFNFRDARKGRPALSLLVSAAYGIIGVGIASLSFTGATSLLEGLFRGPSLAFAVVAAGIGCWLYIFLSWQRFAAMFAGGDGFSALLYFYARAAVVLISVMALARLTQVVASPVISGLLLCTAGGAAAAAAFHTVLAFVPNASDE
ncbi:MAG: hypothetical protein AAF720_07700 [Pseudomonadota bacterium]